MPFTKNDQTSTKMPIRLIIYTLIMKGDLVAGIHIEMPSMDATAHADLQIKIIVINITRN